MKSFKIVVALCFSLFCTHLVWADTPPEPGKSTKKPAVRKVPTIPKPIKPIPKSKITKPLTTHKFTFEAFVDAGFWYRNTLTDPTNEAWSWTINEIELAVQYDYFQYVTARIALNYLEKSASYSGVTLLDSTVQEGFVQVYAPLNPNWKFYGTLGRYFAFTGWEAVNTVDLFQISASLVNDGTPGTTTGIKIGLKGPWLDLSVQIVNGFDQIKEIDKVPTIGVAAGLNFGIFQAATSFFTGSEPGYVKESATAEEQRIGMFDIHLSLVAPDNRMFVMAELLLTSSLATGDMYYGIQITLHGMFHPRWIGGTLRYSRIGDEQGLKGIDGNQDEFTIALLSRPWKGLTIMAEYRADLLQKRGTANADITSHFFGFKAIYKFSIGVPVKE